MLGNRSVFTELAIDDRDYQKRKAQFSKTVGIIGLFSETDMDLIPS